MTGFVDIYTLIFLVLAVVIFFKLRGVLGQRTGNERPPFDPYSRREKPAEPDAAGADKVISLPRRGGAPAGSEPAVATAAVDERVAAIAPEGSALAAALRTVIAADPAFDPKQFLDGARGAYEMIVTAFAAGDRKTLKPLLSRDVYDGFVGAITEREGRGETIEFNFVGIDRSEIVEATLKGTTAHVTVRFVAKLITATRNKAGEVVDGDPVHVTDVTDIWTFARETNSRDPNWKLVATESVE